MNHLLLSQQSMQEPVSMNFLDELKNISDDAQLDNQSNLIGALSVLHCYEETFDYFANKYPRLSINVTGGLYIKFADSNVLNVLLENNIGDGIGITIAQAALVSSLPSFSGNTDITSFDELKYFTRITSSPMFSGCTNLESIDLSGITYLSQTAFKQTALKKVTALNVTSSSWQVFWGCKNLEEANISSLNITSGEQADMFNGCTNLKKVILKPNTTYLPNSFFSGCSKLEEIENLDFSELTATGVMTFGSCNSLFGEDKPFVNSNITSLNKKVFISNTSITEVRLPNCTEIIASTDNQGAFQSCTNLHTAVFSSLLDTIPLRTFQYCTNLKTFDFSNIKYIGNYVFDSSGIENINDMNKIIEIGNMAFNKCYGLTSVSLPETLTSCGSSAFENCTNITSVVLPNSLTVIPNSMFNICRNLVSVTLGNAVTSIGRNAFAYCSNLQRLELPATVTSIDDWAFGNCKNGFKLIIHAITPPTFLAYEGLHILNAVVGSKIYVPDDSVEAYKSAWTNFTDKIYGMSEM